MAAGEQQQQLGTTQRSGLGSPIRREDAHAPWTSSGPSPHHQCTSRFSFRDPRGPRPAPRLRVPFRRRGASFKFLSPPRFPGNRRRSLRSLDHAFAGGSFL
ncbi:hypothetical protein PAHAL_5G031100 [Panicum hallii]|uniref:Uncharacterized protein n=1 Tax=Panicum hallii TaxID=206008 RepID=A0A2S3HNC2_9POAL|nr:hypothetical protein PAHAL_5G031100 [Panicum hallii]